MPPSPQYNCRIRSSVIDTLDIIQAQISAATRTDVIRVVLFALVSLAKRSDYMIRLPLSIGSATPTTADDDHEGLSNLSFRIKGALQQDIREVCERSQIPLEILVAAALDAFCSHFLQEMAIEFPVVFRNHEKKV